MYSRGQTTMLFTEGVWTIVHQSPLLRAQRIICRNDPGQTRSVNDNNNGPPPHIRILWYPLQYGSLFTKFPNVIVIANPTCIINWIIFFQQKPAKHEDDISSKSTQGKVSENPYPITSITGGGVRQAARHTKQDLAGFCKRWSSCKYNITSTTLHTFSNRSRTNRSAHFFSKPIFVH
jgi:hypothetical protein